MLSGADLVKPVAFHATDPKNLGTDIFGRLVPMGAYEAASVFSEEKAKLLRSVVSSVTEKDEELEQYLVSLNAGEIEKLKQDAPSLPGQSCPLLTYLIVVDMAAMFLAESVLEHHRNLQGKSMLVKKLHSDLQSNALFWYQLFRNEWCMLCSGLMELSAKVTKDIEDIHERKKEEVEGEEAFQSRFGARTPSQVCAALWKDATNYQSYHNQAVSCQAPSLVCMLMCTLPPFVHCQSKSNTELKAMFDQHYQYLLLLSGPLASLQATVPKMTPMDGEAYIPA